MLNILHSSDLHTDAEGFRLELEKILDPVFTPDIVLFTGDMIRNFRKLSSIVYDKQSEGDRQKIEWAKIIDIVNEIYDSVPIVSVPGNHDFYDCAIDGSVESFDSTTPNLIEVKGYKFAGFSGVNWIDRGRWRDELNERSLKLIFEILMDVGKEADILVTHGPGHMILDQVYAGCNVGYRNFSEVIKGLPKLKLHAFGHIHEAHGLETHNGVMYSNAATTFHKLTIP